MGGDGNAARLDVERVVGELRGEVLQGEVVSREGIESERRVGGMVVAEIVAGGEEEGGRSDDVLEEAVEFAVAIMGED